MNRLMCLVAVLFLFQMPALAVPIEIPGTLEMRLSDPVFWIETDNNLTRDLNGNLGPTRGSRQDRQFVLPTTSDAVIQVLVDADTDSAFVNYSFRSNFDPVVSESTTPVTIRRLVDLGPPDFPDNMGGIEEELEAEFMIEHRIEVTDINLELAGDTGPWPIVVERDQWVFDFTAPAPPVIQLVGTVELTGPTETKTIPFDVSFEQIAFEPSVFAITGAEGFPDTTAYVPIDDLEVRYERRVVIGTTVDEVPVSVQATPSLVFFTPEPSGLVTLSLVLLISSRQRRPDRIVRI